MRDKGLDKFCIPSISLLLSHRTVLSLSLIQRPHSLPRHHHLHHRPPSASSLVLLSIRVCPSLSSLLRPLVARILAPTISILILHDYRSPEISTTYPSTNAEPTTWSFIQRIVIKVWLLRPTLGSLAVCSLLVPGVRELFDLTQAHGKSVVCLTRESRINDNTKIHTPLFSGRRRPLRFLSLQKLLALTPSYNFRNNRLLFSISL